MSQWDGVVKARVKKPNPVQKSTVNAGARQKRANYFHLQSPYRMSLPLLLLTLALVAVGLIVLFSSSMAIGYAQDKDPLFYVLRQGGYTLVGLLLGLVIIFLPIKIFDHGLIVVLGYLLSLGLVVYTLVFGEVIENARRWIKFGSFTFQPSELVKIALVLCIAGYRSWLVKMRKKGRLRTRNPQRQDLFDAVMDVAFPGLLLLACLAVVLMQPHLSFFIIMSAVIGICFLVSAIPLKSWIYGSIILLVIVVAGGGMGFLLVPQSEKDKITKNFEHVAVRMNIYDSLNSEEKDKAADENELYQSRQSMIAIASGGMTGLGFGNSRQKYSYLPAAQNDYVYSIACEELGFIGGVGIIVLFLGFMVGGLTVAWRTNSDFARILAVGLTSLISIQAFFNIGVAIGALPPTGVTLPFFSYGGTANLFFIVAAAMLLAVSRTGVARKKVTFID